MNAPAVPGPRPGLDLAGARVLVTGATGGIGRAVCQRLAACDARVAVHYLRNRDAAEEIAAPLSGRALVVQGNLAEPAEAEAVVDAAARQWEGLDGIVHCASLGTFRPLLETRTSHWDLTMAVHTRALWLCAQRAAPALSRGSSIVALSSLGARRFTPAYGAVGVAKAGLEGLVRYLAAELAPRAVRVNGIAGGPVEGERLRGSPVYPGLRAAAAERPGGRFGTPDEIADVVLFLTSPLSRWVQGQVLVVDGGFSLW